MGPTLVLFFADQLVPEEFVELVSRLGGRAYPDEWTDASLQRGDAYVHVYAQQDIEEPLDAEDRAMLERKLGCQSTCNLGLGLGKTTGSCQLTFELIEAAADRWTFVVDNERGKMFTPQELRIRATTDPEHIFWNASTSTEEQSTDNTPANTSRSQLVHATFKRFIDIMRRK